VSTDAITHELRPRAVSPAVAAGPRPGAGRPEIDGKFLAVGGRRLRIRGVSYGTFAPDADGYEVGDRATVEADFDAMSRAGVNTVRVYAVPPRWLLDVALERGLWVLVGLAWEQHVAFLDSRAGATEIVSRVRSDAAACAGHPALLGFAIGNEIPAAIVRWHGRARIERFLRRLCATVKAEDSEALVTYVNFPSTEYLRLPFLDFVAFNVYLEDEQALGMYLMRLQNEAGERPLVLAEVGLDSRRNGVDAQAASLAAQLRRGDRAGCAGAIIFSWTDEWHRGGTEVVDWDFGLTDRSRRPKPALAAVADAFSREAERAAPPISVVVCTHNGAATLDDCLRAATALDYPDYEVIVIDDGSTDGSAEIAAGHRVRLVQTDNEGLSAARNRGLATTTGEIVAYLDDDAFPDSDWLRYLAIAFDDSGHVAVGGPNLPVPGDGDVAACVANAPGGPQHVLLSDHVAEHIPGCNMAFRREALEQIGGFDERFRHAGDDVDVCWRLQARGQTIGFHPAAVVWHHRRRTVRGFWRQQRGYGHAEGMLERKWPEKYNVTGHLTWSGRLYGRGSARARPRIYYGVWGTSGFQQRAPAPAASGLLSHAGAPEWYLVVLVLAMSAAGGVLWRPLLVALPLLAAAIALLAGHAIVSAARADFSGLVADGRGRLRLRALTAALHVMQPLARLGGRLAEGLSPWRQARLEPTGAIAPLPAEIAIWLERGEPVEVRLGRLERALRAAGLRVRRAGAFARWELEAATGTIGAGRVRVAVEEHGHGRQQLRARIWPAVPPWVCAIVPSLGGLSALAALDGAWPVTAILGLGGLLLAAGAIYECCRATAAIRRALIALDELLLERRPFEVVGPRSASLVRDAPRAVDGERAVAATGARS